MILGFLCGQNILAHELIQMQQYFGDIKRLTFTLYPYTVAIFLLTFVILALLTLGLTATLNS